VVNKYKMRLESYLHEDNCCNKNLEKVEQLTGVDRVYLFSGVVGVISLWLMVGYGSAFLAAFIGFVYPAYCSIKAIESIDKDDDTKWLTYWVVYATFCLLEFFTDIFLFWIPLYQFLKVIFFIFCMAPTSWNGSLLIYHRLIKPFALKHQSRIDAAISKGGDFLHEAGKDVRGYSEDAAVNHFSNSSSSHE